MSNSIVLKGEEAYKRMAEIIFDACSLLVNIKLTKVVAMASFKAGIQTQDNSQKPGVFTMHDGVAVGDSRMVFRRLMGEELGPIVKKYVSVEKMCPFQVIKEFAQLVDGITFKFI